MKFENFTGIKQRILTYLYHRCTDSTQIDNFLHTFAQFRSLRMWQMQLVTPSIILIRFVNEGTSSLTLFFLFLGFNYVIFTKIRNVY